MSVLLKLDILLFQLVDVAGAIHYQRENIRFHRFLAEIIGPKRDGLDRILPVIVASNHNHLGARCDREDLFQGGQALADAAGVGGEAEIEGYHHRLVASEVGDGLFPIARYQDLKVIKTPSQLALQATSSSTINRCLLKSATNYLTVGCLFLICDQLDVAFTG